MSKLPYSQLLFDNAQTVIEYTAKAQNHIFLDSVNILIWQLLETYLSNKIKILATLLRQLPKPYEFHRQRGVESSLSGCLCLFTYCFPHLDNVWDVPLGVGGQDSLGIESD
jgi:hypothetical protein